MPAQSSRGGEGGVGNVLLRDALGLEISGRTPSNFSLRPPHQPHGRSQLTVGHDGLFSLVAVSVSPVLMEAWQPKSWHRTGPPGFQRWGVGSVPRVGSSQAIQNHCLLISFWKKNAARHRCRWQRGPHLDEPLGSFCASRVLILTVGHEQRKAVGISVFL